MNFIAQPEIPRRRQKEAGSGRFVGRCSRPCRRRCALYKLRLLQVLDNTAKPHTRCCRAAEAREQARVARRVPDSYVEPSADGKLRNRIRTRAPSRARGADRPENRTRLTDNVRSVSKKCFGTFLGCRTFLLEWNGLIKDQHRGTVCAG